MLNVEIFDGDEEISVLEAAKDDFFESSLYE